MAPSKPKAGSLPSLPESDSSYAVVSVLYHALQAAQTLEDYIEDAEESDDEELAQFFQETRQQQIAIAQGAKALLAERISDGADDSEE